MKNRQIDYGYNLSLSGKIATKENNVCVDPYERLVTAIFVQAANDYRRLFRMKLNGEYLLPKEEQEFNETEQFFYENDFVDIINVDGEYIMNQIVKEEVQKKRENSNQERSA